MKNLITILCDIAFLCLKIFIIIGATKTPKETVNDVNLQLQINELNSIHFVE